MNRRRFVKRGLQTGVAASFPALLDGCAVAPLASARDDQPAEADNSFDLSTADLEAVLNTLGANGADFGEVFIQERRTREMRLENDQIVRGRDAGFRGAGLRVVRGDAQGFASTDDLDEAALKAAAEVAADALIAADPKPAKPLERQVRPSSYPFSARWEDVGDARPVALLRDVATRIRNADRTVGEIRCGWHDADETVLIATLDGRYVIDERPMTRLSVEVTATRSGRSHTAFASVAARAGSEWYTDAGLAQLAGIAVDRVDALFAARRPPLGEMPIVLAAGTGGAVLHETIAQALEADVVHSRQSPFANALNQRITDSAITIVDEPRLRHERGALNFDDEAHACERTVLVENGVLRGFLHDRRSARLFSTTSTGSARRESYRDAPMPRTTCMLIENGTAEPEELLAAMGRGIIVESIVGGSVATDGQYRFHVKHGWLVEKGSRLVPVRDFDLVGSPADIMANVQLVGNDLSMDPAGWSYRKNGQTVPVSHGMPSVLVSAMGIEARG